MHIPPPVGQGDKIGVVFPARSTEGLPAADYMYAVRLLRSAGFDVIEGTTCRLRHHIFAGTEQERADDLQRFIDAPDIKAIIGGRGGYGTVQLVDKLDLSPLREQPKLVAGFSDITVLHGYLNNVCGIGTLHAPVLTWLKRMPQKALKSFISALYGKPYAVKMPYSHPQNREGIGKGQLVGGNLSVLCSLIGTPGDFDPIGKILFIEEVDEYLYMVDRMMHQLRLAGKLDGLQGLIVGEFAAIHDNDDIPFGETAQAIVRRHAADYDFPIWFAFPAGHIADNRTLALGRNVKLDLGTNYARLQYI